MTFTPLSVHKRDASALTRKTRLLVGDPSGERWTEARVLEALNLACLDFAVETECIKDEVGIQLLENQWSYNIKTATEADATLKPYGWSVRIGYYGKQSPALSPISTPAVDYSGITLSTQGTTTKFKLDLMSYGELSILPIPSEDGSALPSEDGNIQVAYIGMPDEMATTSDYPDSNIQATYHQFLPMKAAAYLLEEGDDEDLSMAVGYEQNFMSGCYEAIGDQYQGETGYADMRPM